MSLEAPEPQPAGPPICGPPLPWECSILDAVKKDPSDVEPPMAINEGSAILPPFVATVGSDALLQADAPPDASMGSAMQFASVFACLVVLMLLATALGRRIRRRKAAPTSIRH